MDTHWRKIVVGLLLFSLMLWHPLTRQIIFVILPIGKNPDDFLVGGLMLAGLIYIIGKKRSQLIKIKEKYE